ncbi:MAG TPA: helix-turn-helix domain-containing protein [Ktedonobacteraceae bacterium]|nr:helix-turn-helix domain-containing protein [Ktedonobacteraceae bacterium]
MKDLAGEAIHTKESRGARRRARTRSDLLAAARKVFAERGYHEASIADITSEADVGVGTFYLHFRDKDAIFNTLIEEQYMHIRQRVISEIRQHGKISLAILIHILYRQAYKDRDVFRLALMSGELLAHRFRARQMISLGLTRLLEDARGRGTLSINEEDISLQAQLIMGVLLQGLAWWFEHDEPEPDAMAEQVIHLLAHGLPAPLFEARPVTPEQIEEVLDH